MSKIHKTFFYRIFCFLFGGSSFSILYIILYNIKTNLFIFLLPVQKSMQTFLSRLLVNQGHRGRWNHSTFNCCVGLDFTQKFCIWYFFVKHFFLIRLLINEIFRKNFPWGYHFLRWQLLLMKFAYALLNTINEAFLRL